MTRFTKKKEKKEVKKEEVKKGFSKEESLYENKYVPSNESKDKVVFAKDHPTIK